MNCKFCNIEFELTHGNQGYCSKKCVEKARHRRNYKPTEEKFRRDKLAENEPERKIYYGIKSRCKTSNIPFDLEVSDIIIPEVCPVLGFPLKSALGQVNPNHNSPSVDRIDPTKGYVKSNIKVISYRANVLKNNAKIEELEAILKYMKENQS